MPSLPCLALPSLYNPQFKIPVIAYQVFVKNKTNRLSISVRRCRIQHHHWENKGNGEKKEGRKEGVHSLNSASTSVDCRRGVDILWRMSFLLLPPSSSSSSTEQRAIYIYTHTLQHTVIPRQLTSPPTQTLTFIPAFVGSEVVLKGFASSLSSSSHFHFVTVFSSFLNAVCALFHFFQLFEVRHSSMLMKADTAERLFLFLIFIIGPHGERKQTSFRTLLLP